MSTAAAAPGVHAVITSKDMPEIGSKIADLGEGMFDLKDLTRIVLAREKVVYKGHAVAAVAAETIHQAEEAARLIEVDYELLPPVLDVRAAMQDDAPILHEDMRTKAFASSADDPGKKPTNIAKHFFHEKGDGDYVLSRNPEFIHLGSAVGWAQTKHTPVPPFRGGQEIWANPEFKERYKLFHTVGDTVWPSGDPLGVFGFWVRNDVYEALKSGG